MFFRSLPTLFSRWALAWLLCFAILVILFRVIRGRVRLAQFDAAMNGWARRLRYKLLQVDAALEPDTPPRERVLLTWFFRFWTNFASSPALSIFSILLPIWMFHQRYDGVELYTPSFLNSEIWLLPGLCFCGAMLLSCWIKRVFRRVRPARAEGAFGHKLKDYSFPSGHSLTAFCFWMMCLIAYITSGASTTSALLFGVVAVAIVLLTGLSRFYLGVHWPSDVAGGFGIGAVWTALCYIALRGAL